MRSPNPGVDGDQYESIDLLIREVEDLYMPHIRASIREIAQSNLKGKQVDKVTVFRAFETYFAKNLPLRSPPLDRSQLFVENIFVIIVAIMAIIFGVLGLFPSIFGGTADTAKSFLDISKIFAGAVVGGAAGSTAAAMTKRVK